MVRRSRFHLYRKVMKKVLIFFALCLYLLGTIGGFGYAAYGGSWPIAVGVAFVGWMAFDKAKNWFKVLIG